MATPSISTITPSQRVLGILQLTAGAAMISFSAVFVKLAHVGPTMAGFYRMLFGGLILTAVLWIRGERLWHGTRSILMAFACSIFFALDLSFWHRSIQYVGPGLATLLANFQVFFLAGFGIILLGEKPTRKLLISIPLALAGLYLIVGPNWRVLGANYKAGILFGLLAAVGYAAYILTLRKFQTGSRRSALSTIALISLLTSLIMGLEALVQQERFSIPDLQSWAALVGYGLFPQVFGWVLISVGLLRVETSRVGLILLLQPTLAFVWDILFFARPTVPLEFLGAILTLVAIYFGMTR